MTGFVRFAFFVALVVTLVLATAAHAPSLSVAEGDKLYHILAFTVLGVLGTLAFPRLSPLTIVAGLIALGAVIELVQAIPSLHRDSSIADLAADALAAAIATFVTRALALRSKG